MLFCIEGIAQNLKENSNWTKLQNSFLRNFRYPTDLEKDSIPSFITLKVLYHDSDTSFTIDFSDNAHPLVIEEFLRVKDKLNFKSVYKDLEITDNKIPVLIPIQIQMNRPSVLFLKPESFVFKIRGAEEELDSDESSSTKSVPKNQVMKDMHTFKGELTRGECYFYTPISLFIIND